MTKHTFFLGLLMLLGFACSKFQQIQKNPDVNVKKEAAYKYYEKKDFYRSGELLAELIPLLKGTEDDEKAQYYYAFTQYELRFLETSAFLFRTFKETYPRSIYTQEAGYMEVLSMFEDTPRYYLDQSNTEKTISAIEEFIREFPDSPKREKCQEMIDILVDKLQTKAFENARLYYKIMDYKAAIISLGNFHKEYPGSEYAEEALFLRVAAGYKLAKISTETKQLDRFNQVIEFYLNFVDKYPTSKFLKTAEGYYDSATNQVNKLKNKS